MISKTEKKLDGKFNVLPAPKPVFEGEEEKYVPNQTIYESDAPFPGKNTDFIGTKYFNGIKVAHIVIYLFQYKPKSGWIIALDSLKLAIIYEKILGKDSQPKCRKPRKSPVNKLILDYEKNFSLMN